MPSYSFLLVDHEERVLKREDRECGSDAEALSMGEALAGEFGVEVWRGPHKVGEFKF